jgi:anti-sigma regulatory factor (Ser/Thr protein kinase)
MVAGKDAAEPTKHTSLEIDLRRDESAPGVARAAITGLCERVGLTGARGQTLVLLVSEIVTNAVVHSTASPETPIQLKAHADAERVRVDVHDGGQDFAHQPAAQQQGGGWGLRLVEREARRWGVQRNDGTRVWFELALDPSVETSA